ncbi:pilus assembly protein N-terminal domain-containing protein [Kluyvera ascorbata]|uniref:type II and III secretion system protein family protein n=1 Tax=Kluyvera ascorbata TaxID=51288 RepID=UPI002AB8ECE9|nr:pilus assembly protein N-terminal domain-containing protein [Kluyvera ascorbata]MDZ4034090.1 pilus assembly protein N-terminal domain-containing protein [Kluyvera ascorbata]
MLKIARKFILLLTLHCMVSMASAEDVVLKEGQARNISVSQAIDTVFISNPDIADYKVIDNKKIVLFAKKVGVADLTVYGKKGKVLNKMSIAVDSFGNALTDKVNKQFPGTNIQIERYMSGDKLTYILKGDVATEEVRDQIYNTVGSLVGTDKKENQVSHGDDNVELLSKTRWDNVIDRMTILSSPQQVNVKLTVVEVTKQFTDALGIEWSSLTLDSIINGGSAANNTGVFSLIGFKGGFDAGNISTVINAVKNDSIARVLAQPNLTVLSGEYATFLVGGEIPIVVDSGGDSSTSVQYKEYGIRLNIGAKVNRTDKIRLYISNELSNVTGSYTYNSYAIPTINTRKTQSTIELADGDSFVIGGLLSESDRESLSKVPYAGDIPILGAFARSSQTEREKSELVVFATVKLVKPIPASENYKLPVPEFHKTTVDKLFFNVGVADEHNDELDKNEGIGFISRGGFIR